MQWQCVNIKKQQKQTRKQTCMTSEPTANDWTMTNMSDVDDAAVRKKHSKITPDSQTAPLQDARRRLVGTRIKNIMSPIEGSAKKALMKNYSVRGTKKMLEKNVFSPSILFHNNFVYLWNERTHPIYMVQVLVFTVVDIKADSFYSTLKGGGGLSSPFNCFHIFSLVRTNLKVFHLDSRW